MIAPMRFLLSLVVLIPLCAQQPEGNRPAGQQPHAPTNLKLLQPNEIRSAMGAFRTALGVQCNFCHVQGNFASDDKKEKDIARTMIVMTREINAKFPDGKTHVTCYTCHRGATEPLTAAADAPAGQSGSGQSPKDAPPPPPPAQ